MLRGNGLYVIAVGLVGLCLSAAGANERITLNETVLDCVPEGCFVVRYVPAPSLKRDTAMTDQTKDTEWQSPPLVAGMVVEPNSEEETEKPNDDNDNADPAPETREQRAQRDANSRKHMGDNGKGKGRDGGANLTDYGQLIFSLFLTLATVSLAFNAYFTLQRMEKNATEQTRQFNEQMKEIRRQITASEDANSIAREAMIANRRPWVVPQIKVREVQFDDNKPWFDIEIVSKNIGNTPASSVFYEIAFHPYSVGNASPGWEGGDVADVFHALRAKLLKEPKRVVWDDEPGDVFRLFPDQVGGAINRRIQLGFSFVEEPSARLLRAINPIIFVGVSYRIPNDEGRRFAISAVQVISLDTYETRSGDDLEVIDYVMPANWETEN